jgi:hypothetical protein
LAYLVSVDFIGNLVATAVVVGLAILIYKLSMRLVPRILRWHLPGDLVHKSLPFLGGLVG